MIYYPNFNKEVFIQRHVSAPLVLIFGFIVHLYVQFHRVFNLIFFKQASKYNYPEHLSQQGTEIGLSDFTFTFTLRLKNLFITEHSLDIQGIKYTMFYQFQKK